MALLPTSFRTLLGGLSIRVCLWHLDDHPYWFHRSHHLRTMFSLSVCFILYSSLGVLSVYKDVELDVRNYTFTLQLQRHPRHAQRLIVKDMPESPKIAQKNPTSASEPTTPSSSPPIGMHTSVAKLATK